MNGAAVVIIGSQIGKLCGISLKESNTLVRFFEWAMQLGKSHGPTILIGLSCVAILVLCRWKLRRMPGAIIVFVLAIIAGRFMDFSQYGMQLVGNVDLRLPSAEQAGLTIMEAAPLFTAAIGIALLVFSEGVVLGRTVAGKHGCNIDPDRELIAFGAANVVAGLLCTFAVGSSQTRTLLNDATGGRTQMVSFLAAALTAVFALLLMPWIAAIPSVVIAAILIFTGVTLIDLRIYGRLWRQHRYSMLVALATTVGVIALGALPGIMLGVVLSLLCVLAEIVRPQDALLGCVKGSSTMHDIGDDEAAKTIPGLVVYRFYGPVIFANVRYFIERVESFIAQEHGAVRQLILDARAIPSIDITAAEQLAAYVGCLRDRGIEVVVVKAHLPLRQTLSAIGDVFDGCWRFSQLADAVAAFKENGPVAAVPTSCPSTQVQADSSRSPEPESKRD
jgi:SulP family sulfate permease